MAKQQSIISLLDLIYSKSEEDIALALSIIEENNYELYLVIYFYYKSRFNRIGLWTSYAPKSLDRITDLKTHVDISLVCKHITENVSVEFLELLAKDLEDHINNRYNNSNITAHLNFTKK